MTHTFKTLTPWTQDGSTLYRALKGTDKRDTKNRVALISNTASIRIAKDLCGVELPSGFVNVIPKGDVWVQCPTPITIDSKQVGKDWCDVMLIKLGYN